MLKRKIVKKLNDWKADVARKSLIIEGPQQIGKTFILRTFGYQNYKQVVYINFNQYPYMKRLFEMDMELDALILQMTLLIQGAKCIPYETLIILEEIDLCPPAMNALIKFSSDPRYDVIATRTMLMTLNNPEEVSVLRMHALDFEEFLWANNVSSVTIQEIKNNFLQCRPVPSDLHKYLLDMFRYYLAVGGMPRTVHAFLNTGSYEGIRLSQRFINDVYLSDIVSRVELNKKSRAVEIFHSIPKQIRNGNKRFKYSEVAKNASYRTHWESILFLYQMGWLFTIFKAGPLNLPLLDNRQDDNFKLCVRDNGCLVGQLDDGDVEYLYEPLVIQKNILLENCVAELLVKRGLRMFYSEDGQHRFLIAQNKDRKIGLCFDDSNTLRRMNKLVDKGLLDEAYDLIVEPLNKDRSGIHLPLYNLMFVE